LAELATFSEQGAVTCRFSLLSLLAFASATLALNLLLSELRGTDVPCSRSEIHVVETEK
jgi:hypothetical protein